jgi:integrase
MITIIISKRTELNYTRIVNRLLRLLGRSNQQPDPQGFINVLTDRLTPLTESTWRVMRAAVKWWLATNNSSDAALLFTEKFRTTRKSVHRKTKPPRQFPERLALDLVTHLRRKPYGRNKELAAHMIIAGIATGLRPVEWSSVKIENNHLIVINAKYRKGISGNGTVRRLEMVNLTAEQRQSVDYVASRMAGKTWDNYGQRIRTCLSNAKKRLLKFGLITPAQARTRLYEARHQFSANAKLMLENTKGEVAAAMGHRSAMTAHISYGKRSKACLSTFGIKPSRDSLEGVDKASITRLVKSISRMSVWLNNRNSSNRHQSTGVSVGRTLKPG